MPWLLGEPVERIGRADVARRVLHRRPDRRRSPAASTPARSTSPRPAPDLTMTLPVDVTLTVTDARLAIDTPGQRATVSNGFTIAGWAVDLCGADRHGRQRGRRLRVPDRRRRADLPRHRGVRRSARRRRRRSSAAASPTPATRWRSQPDARRELPDRRLRQEHGDRTTSRTPRSVNVDVASSSAPAGTDADGSEPDAAAGSHGSAARTSRGAAGPTPTPTRASSVDSHGAVLRRDERRRAAHGRADG